MNRTRLRCRSEHSLGRIRRPDLRRTRPTEAYGDEATPATLSWRVTDARPGAWLAAHTARSVLTVLLRVAWRTVAAIVARVVADGRDTNDLLTRA